MRNYFIKVSKHIENKNQKKYFKKNQNQKKKKTNSLKTKTK